MRYLRKHGFTLVELLVVIAIIALLLSLLMPALGRVREQAKEQVCKAHLKQFGYAVELYAEDNKNSYPSSKDEVNKALYPVPTDYDNWAFRVFPYTSKNYSVYKCPAALTDASGGKVAGWSKDTERYGVCYIYNGAAAAFKRGVFDHPSEKIIMQDLGWKSFTAWLRVPTASNCWFNGYADYPDPSYRSLYKDVSSCLKALGWPETATWSRHKHGKNLWGRNLLMMDGHVEWTEWGTGLNRYLPASELSKRHYVPPVKR